MKRIAICGDTHGDHIDYRCRDAFFEFLSDFKPDTRVHLGDAFDFRALRKGASVEEKADNGREDIKEGMAFLREYFRTDDMGKNIFIWGNHCDRILDGMKSSHGPTQSHSMDVWENINKFLKSRNVVDPETYYDSRNGVAEEGPFRFLHGYSSAMNAAKEHCSWAGLKPCVVSGHNHYRDYWRDISYDRRESFSCSCMCDIDPDYARKNKRKLRHSKGWIYGWYDDTDYELYHVEEKNGKYITLGTPKIY